ncbi:hypothetical protein MCOR19_000436 [Pyricularia oryzae]|nr:hypothetical protein MCOR19_000436 [Pyricularia oryzae]KAI6479689.1 hypothetical protein MCOR18_005575 [Pyricularia oryzae]
MCVPLACPWWLKSGLCKENQDKARKGKAPPKNGTVKKIPDSADPRAWMLGPSVIRLSFLLCRKYYYVATYPMAATAP